MADCVLERDLPNLKQLLSWLKTNPFVSFDINALIYVNDYGRPVLSVVGEAQPQTVRYRVRTFVDLLVENKADLTVKDTRGVPAFTFVVRLLFIVCYYVC